jgi:branched-chain amino acid transport system substrate-binding protein
MKKQMRIAQPLQWMPVTKEGGPDLYAGIYAGINFYWEVEETIPSARRYVAAFRQRFGAPPLDYSSYAYSGILELARGVELAKSTDSDAVANALRAHPVYDHYKGKQWWRGCDNKSFQDLWIIRGRDPDKVRNEWGLLDVVTRVPADERLDRSCAEKGLA